MVKHIAIETVQVHLLCHNEGGFSLPESMNQGRKRNPNPNFLVRIIFGGGGGGGDLPREGVGQKVRYVLRNAGKPNFLAGYPGICCRDIPGVPEKFESKSLCSILLP